MVPREGRETPLAGGGNNKIAQSCEFHAGPEQQQKGLRSGFCECWLEKRGLTEKELDQPNVFDIWNFRGKGGTDRAWEVLLRDVAVDEIGVVRPQRTPSRGCHRSSASGCSREGKNGEKSFYFDKAGLAGKWTNGVPVHFIDFETSMSQSRSIRAAPTRALHSSSPPCRPRGRPDRARGAYLNARPGVFPSYDFLRA